MKTRLFLELDPLIPEFLQHKIFPTEYKIRGSGFNIKRIGGIWDRFTNFFTYNDESQENEETCTIQKDHELQEILYRISQMEDQIESILKILTTDQKLHN